MQNYNHAVTPSEPRQQLSKNVEEAETDPTQYRSLIGSLRYLCNTRPDLAYSVDDRKSTADYVFMLGGAPIAWSSKKESVVALSSCEADHIAASQCACQAIWLVNLVDEIMGEDHGSVTMKIDNISAINLAKNPVAHRDEISLSQGTGQQWQAMLEALQKWRATC
ncbi:copia protein [Trifolium medium]|uniref:Copia protein n=1 Tax=Trifolium medium TaxID=97028 RepID=A0A392ME44_9FABA|nr:copia protein [Trifolium medium]